jgi:hypothetical protein
VRALVFGRFLGVLFLDPGSSFLAFSFLAFRSWALLLAVLEVLSYLDSRRPLHGLRLSRLPRGLFASCGWVF